MTELIFEKSPLARNATGDDAMSNMSPSKPIADGQIGKINELISAKLRKSGLHRDPVQQVLEYQGEALAADLLAVVRKHVDAVSDMISRRVTINRSLSPEQALKATGRNQYVTNSVVATMPRGDKDEGEVFFLKRDQWTSDSGWDAHLDSLGLKPCDPHTLAKVNEDDPAFADDHPNGTHWKDDGNNWCFATFDRWSGERRVDVDCDGSDWNGSWWFAGVRK